MKESEFYCHYFTADRTEQQGLASLHEAEQKVRALAAESVDPATAVRDRSGKPCVLIWGPRKFVELIEHDYRSLVCDSSTASRHCSKGSQRARELLSTPWIATNPNFS